MLTSIMPYIVLFFYIYAIPFNFLPISTRVLFGILGFLLLAIKIYQRKVKLVLSKKLFQFSTLLFLIPLVALISVHVNQTNDIEFIKYPLSISIIIFSSYFVFSILHKYYYKLTFEVISGLVINIVLFQSVIAFIMFLVPDLRDFLLGIQRLSADDVERMTYFFDFRIVGFGVMFFDAGMINGFALILTGAIIKFYNLQLKQVTSLSIKFLFILLIGMMMARVAVIGGLLGLILIFYPSRAEKTVSRFKRKFLFIFHITIIPVLLVSILLILTPKMDKTLEPLFNFAFEIFINYFEKGSAESASTNRLQEMYIYPDNIKTWVIGDGLWNASDKSGYYMKTDVGYLRLIYYFGLIGLGNFLVMQFFLIKNSFKHKLLIYILTLYLLILNLKGFTDLVSIILVFFTPLFIHRDGSKE